MLMKPTTPVNLAANTLTTVAAMKTHLGLGPLDDDTPIIDCINSASAWIHRITGREFKAQDHVEFHALVPGQTRITLKHFPVIGQVSAHAGPGRGLAVHRTHRALEATAQVKDDAVVLRWVDVMGTERETLVPIPRQSPMQSLAREISKVPGWSALAASRCPAVMLIPGQVIDAQGAGPQPFLSVCVRPLDCPSPADGANTIDVPRGVRMPGVLRLAYRAGYEQIPAEVEALCIRMAARVYEAGTATLKT